MMPEMDGYETCRILREDPATKFIPIVMVTALGDQDARNKGLAAGANDFLTKPVDKTEVFIRAKNLLRVKEFEDFMIRHNQILEEEVRKRTLELYTANRELGRHEHRDGGEVGRGSRITG